MSDVYRIAVRIALTNGMSPVLAIISRDLLGVHAKVGEIEKGFGRWTTAIGGFTAVMAGGAILGGMTKLIEKTKEYSDELVKLQRLGGEMGAAVTSGEISKRAFDIAQRVPMKVTDLMKIPGATYSILGEKESMKLWEPLAKFSWVMQSQNDYKGDVGTDLQKILRAGELTGRLTDPVTHQVSVTQTEKFLDLAARTIAATHGMVNPDTLLGMAKQGGFTLRGLSDQGFYTQAIMAQAMGGPRAGTAFLSLWQQMAAGTMFTRTAEGMQEIGLLRPGEWHKDHGRVILGNEASQRLTSLIGKDPLEFAANVIEKLKAKGITEPQEQMRMVMRIMNRQTTQRFTAEMVTNFMQMIAERERLMQGLGSEGSYGVIQNKSVTANIEALGNAWHNMLIAIAAPQTGDAIKVLQALTWSINVASQVAEAHPEAIGIVADALAALATSLVIGGLVALAAAIMPLVGTGAIIVAVAAGLSALAVLNWPAIEAGPAKFAAIIKSIDDEFARIAQLQSPGAMLRALADDLGGALKAIADKVLEIQSWLTPGGIVGHILGAMKGAKIPPLPSLPAPTPSGPAVKTGPGGEDWIGPALPEAVGKQSLNIIPTRPLAPSLRYEIPTPPPDERALENGAASPPSDRGWRGMSVVPPPVKVTVEPANVAINMDGRKMGEAQIAFIVREGAGAVQGAPFYDATFSTAPIDFAMPY